MTRALLIAALLSACGAAPRSAASLRAELGPGLDAARATAGAEVSDAEAALARAEAAEAAGDVEAAADHRAAARLLAAIATERAARAELLEAHAALESEATTLTGEALALEEEAARREAEASRRAAAGAAREEALRALARAEADESRGRRRARLSLDDAAAMREAARAIRARARLLAAAASALDPAAGAEHRAELERLLALSERDEEPMAALTHADEAHRAARALLGAARRARPVDEETVRSLLEAAASEGFSAARLERGVAIDVAFAFEGGARAPSRAAQPRLHRLAALIGSYPEGPVHLEVAGDDGAARARALSGMLADAGVEVSRLVVSEGASSGARLVLVAYVPPAPVTATVLEGEAPATSAAVEAHPTPTPSSE